MIPRTLARAALAAALMAALLAAAPEPFGFSVTPYLQNPAPDSMTIMWIASRNSTGWVEYAAPGAAPRRAFHSEHGLIDANQRVHRVTLTGLKPGTEYTYRVFSKDIVNFAPYKVVYGETISTEPTVFRTPSPGSKLSFLVFTDVHGHTEIFSQMLTANRGRPFDLVLLAGDMLSQLPDEQAVVKFLADAATAFGGRVPMIWIRGNHETRGAFARMFPNYVATPGARFYYSFDWGPARFVVLDTGEDKEDAHAEYSGLADFDAYRAAEARWLAKEVRSPAFRAAPFRIAVAHIPFPGASENEKHGTDAAARLFTPLLDQGGADLLIAGHRHMFAVTPPEPGRHAYAIVRNGAWQDQNKSVIRVDIADGKLHAEILRPDGTVAKTWDARQR